MEISSERIDDIPVIVEWLLQMEIAKWIDQELSPPHGNYQGMSYGLQQTQTFWSAVALVIRGAS